MHHDPVECLVHDVVVVDAADAVDCIDCNTVAVAAVADKHKDTGNVAAGNLIDYSRPDYCRNCNMNYTALLVVSVILVYRLN